MRTDVMTVRKRSDLSSASSEESTTSPNAKRFTKENLATMEDVARGVQSGQDLTLATIWEAVKRIETNTNLMLEEQKILQRNYEDLRVSLEFTQERVDSVVKENVELKDKMKTMSKNCASLQQKAVDFENKLEASKAQKLSLEEKVNELSLMHDDLEQYTRKFNLEIYGIPEESEEDTEQIILDLAKCLNVDLVLEDVDISHRVKKGNIQPRPIIVIFSNYYSKERMYHNRRKLRRVNVREALRGAERVYINENLTAQRASLFKKVRDKKRLHKDWRVWTLDGKIYVKTDPAGTEIIKIQHPKDLDKL